VVCKAGVAQISTNDYLRQPLTKALQKLLWYPVYEVTASRSTTVEITLRADSPSACPV